MPKKVTTKEFIERAKQIHNDFYDYSNVVYKKQFDEVKVVCPDHGLFEVVAKLHIRPSGPIGCPTCGKIRQGKPRLSTQEFIEKANEVHGSKYDYSLTNYTLSSDKITVVCPDHGPWDVRANGHLNGRGCPKCRKRGGHNVFSTEQFIEKAKNTWDETFDYSKVEYRNIQESVIFICKEHGEFLQRPIDHLSGKVGCEECAKLKHKDSLPTISYEEFLQRARTIHGEVYRYELFCDEFLQSKSIISIICSTHGKFEQYAINHISGRGCPKCGDLSSANAKRKSLDSFIVEANKIHKGKYDYTHVDYINNNTPVEIGCSIHSIFKQTPDPHLRGAGCPRCAGRDRTTEEAIDEFRKVHGDRYDYSQTVYTQATTPLKIICKTHGEFHQLYWRHKQGSNCPSCMSGSPSKGEKEVGDFLESIGETVERNLRNIIPPYEIDIYVREHNLAIEYCGLYWHSEKVGKTQNYHRMKHDLCAKKGIRLLTIFEDEWRDKRSIIEASIKHFVKKSPKGCPGRKAKIREIGWPEAKSFLEQNHMLGSGASGKYRVGAYDPNDNLIAVMTWGVPSDERGKTDAMEMKRYACTKFNHPGLASKMFKWSIENYGFDKVIAFVDLRFFEGNFKMFTGFKKIHESQPTLFWTNGIERKKRRFHTKRSLQKLDTFSGTNLTKKEMLEELGYYRIWDCGKVKLEWIKEESCR